VNHTTVFVSHAIRKTISQTSNYIATTHSEANMFATVFFGVLEPNEGWLTYINCGHEPPLVIDPSVGMKYLTPTGPAVGMFPDLDFTAKKIQLEPGAILFAYTDGVVDAQNEKGEFFTKDRLLSLLNRNNDSAKVLVDYIKTEIERYTSKTEQFDDVTMIAVQRKPNKIYTIQ